MDIESTFPSVIGYNKRSWQVYFVRFFLMILLIFFASAIWITLSHTPAFNSNLRGETIVGNGRTPVAAAMYDLGAYEYQRGYGFLNADLLVKTETGELRSPSTEEEAFSAARTALEALKNALRLDPGNVHAWVALAYAEARMGENENALVALRTSWKLAPHNLTAAKRRIAILTVLADPDVAVIDLSEHDQRAIQRDLAIISEHAGPSERYFTTVSPHLLEFR